VNPLSQKSSRDSFKMEHMVTPATRAGAYRRQPAGYLAFFPAEFPPADLVVDGDLLIAMSRADRALARLDGVSTALGDVDLFIRMYMLREATDSSRIEGTQASLVDVVGAQSGPAPPDRRDDVGEVENYVRAMSHGLDRLATQPASLRLVKEIHQVLMSGARGGAPHLTPGEFRRSQNRIGGTSPGDARYTPPPPDEMHRPLSEWESFLHERDRVPPLLQLGLIHAQFETIHPFLDGNGRVGRLLITFLLVEWEILARPLLYLSIFFNAHRDEYYSRLQAVRDEGAWERWLRFFVDGVAETADDAARTVKGVLDLRERHRDAIGGLGSRAANAYKLHDHLFSSPVVDVKSVHDLLGVVETTAGRLLTDLEALGIIVERTGRKRGRSWLYSEYLDLFTTSEERSVSQV